MFIPSHSTWILIYLIPIKSFGQAYMVSVFPVYLLVPWHISFQLCQMEEQNREKSPKLHFNYSGVTEVLHCLLPSPKGSPMYS